MTHLTRPYPELAGIGPESTKIGWDASNASLDSTKLGQDSAKIRPTNAQSLPASPKIWPSFDQKSPASTRTWPRFGQPWPPYGRLRPTCPRLRLKRGQASTTMWPDFDQVGQSASRYCLASLGGLDQEIRLAQAQGAEGVGKGRMEMIVQSSDCVIRRTCCCLGPQSGLHLLHVLLNLVQIWSMTLHTRSNGRQLKPKPRLYRPTPLHIGPISPQRLLELVRSWRAMGILVQHMMQTPTLELLADLEPWCRLASRPTERGLFRAGSDLGRFPPNLWRL